MRPLLLRNFASELAQQDGRGKNGDKLGGNDEGDGNGNENATKQ